MSILNNRLCFIEISDSQRHETGGVEAPGPGSIVRIVD